MPAALGLSLLLVALALPVPCPGAAVVDPFLDAFAEDFVTEPSEAPREEGSDVGAAHQTGFASWRFRSREKVAGTDPPVFLRFRLRLYRFADEGRRDEALAGFAARVRDDMFFKSPLYVIASGSDLYRLDGECSWPRDAWEEVEERLAAVLHPAGITPDTPLLKALCGGAVTLSPLAAPSP